MVDNLARKVKKCPLHWDHQILFSCTVETEKKNLLYGSSCGVSAVQEFEVNGRTVRTSIILWVFAVEGCPQSGVPLYRFSTIY